MSSINRKINTTDIRLRHPDEVMRLERMGSYHPMRLSFSRILLRRMAFRTMEDQYS